MSQDSVFGHMCLHCGAKATRRLGECTVCGKNVCEQCGSVSFSAGVKKAVHRQCLKKADDHFSMIKFVR